jgi:hypothetical protein
MGESRDDPAIYWVDPDKRGVLPLDEFHVPRSLQKVIRRAPYRVTVDAAFTDTISACAEPGPGRQTTWINSTIETSSPQAMPTRSNAGRMTSLSAGFTASPSVAHFSAKACSASGATPAK